MQQLQPSLLDLPSFLLLDILRWLDVQSLCCVSRTCTFLSKVAVHPLLWSHFDHDGCAMWDVRCTLARVLRLPPQVFQVQLDLKRSRKFPVTVSLHNLRPLLNITDTEGLADRLSKAVQEQVFNLSSSLWRFQSWQQYPPAASLSVCRADRATVRASLRPEAVVPRLVQQLQQLGWPPAARTVLAACPADASSPANMGSGSGLNASRPCCYCSAGTPQQPQPDHNYRGNVAVLQQCRGTNSISSRRSCDHLSAMLDCLDVCQSRCELLTTGRLSQLHVQQGDACGGQCSGQEHLAGLSALTVHIMATAAASWLPDPAVLREATVSRLQSLGIPGQAAQHLAPAAVRLLLVAAAADPSMMAFSLPGKPGWMLMLDKAVKVVARFHILQQVCWCSLGSKSCQQQQQQWQDSEQHGGDHLETSIRCSPDNKDACPGRVCVQQPPSELMDILSAGAEGMEAAWHAAGEKELQLCLAGLQDFANIMAGSRVSPARLYQCAQMLEAAAAEYASEGFLVVGSDNITDAVRRLGLLRLQVQQEEQQVMRTVWRPAVPPAGDQLLSSSRSVPGGHSDELLQRETSNNTGHINDTTSAPTPQMFLRCTMHIEALRMLSWCLWLLGVLG